MNSSSKLNTSLLIRPLKYLRNSSLPSQILTRGARRPQARKRTRTRRRSPARQQTSDLLWRSGPARGTRTAGKMATTRTAVHPTNSTAILAAGDTGTSRPLLDNEENRSVEEDIRSSSIPDTLRTIRTDSQIHAGTRTMAKTTPERTRTKIDGRAERRSLCGGAGTGQSHERGAAKRSTPGTRTGTAWRGRTKRTGILTGGKTRGAEMAHRGDADRRLKEDTIKL